MSIKLKDMINESTPGFTDRKFGDPLPTLASVQKAHEAKGPLKEEYIEVMHGLDQGLLLIKDAWNDWKTGPMTEKEDIKPAQKELVKYVATWLKKYIK